MRRLAVTFLTLLLASAALAIGPLGEKEQEQVDTAMDGSVKFDQQAALYPLLSDAMTWRPGDESGAAVPDYAAMMEDPQLHRGKLFLIEGTLARRNRVEKLFRSGDWETNLEEWVVGYGNEQKGVIVYLTDPPAEATRGDRVRIPARFYMVASMKIANSDEMEDFLLFVGQDRKS